MLCDSTASIGRVHIEDTTMAHTRRHDIEEVRAARDGAKNTHDRNHYDKILHKISNESGRVESLRQNLVKAMRGKDMRSINYYTEKIQRER